MDSTARGRRSTACGPVCRRWPPRRARKLMVVSTLAAWPEKLSADLIIRATCRWSRAQCRGLTCIPLLHRLFTPLGLTMIAPSFASLLTMFEAAAGRPNEIGARDRPAQDQPAICAILQTANAQFGSAQCSERVFQYV